MFLKHQNVQVQNEFTITLRNWFGALQAEGNDPMPNTICQNFIQANQEAGRKCIPLQPKIKWKAPWERENLQRIARVINILPDKMWTTFYQTEQQNYIQD